MGIWEQFLNVMQRLFGEAELVSAENMELQDHWEVEFDLRGGAGLGAGGEREAPAIS